MPECGPLGMLLTVFTGRIIEQQAYFHTEFERMFNRVNEQVYRIKSYTNTFSEEASLKYLGRLIQPLMSKLITDFKEVGESHSVIQEVYRDYMLKIGEFSQANTDVDEVLQRIANIKTYFQNFIDQEISILANLEQ